MEMRYYQGDLIDRSRVALRDHHHICVQSPTGSGKSKTFIFMARMAAAAGLTPLIITEATKIFGQLFDEYEESHNIDSDAKIDFIHPHHAYVAMAQTLARRPHLIEQFQKLGKKLFIIYDEAHIGTATKLLLQLRDALLIGFTATPAWQWAKHLSLLYKYLVVGPQVSELIRPPDGKQYLCNYKHFGPVAANLDDLKIKAGEYTEESQEHAFDSNGVYDQLTRDLTNRTYKKCIIFCSSIKHCQTLYKVLFSRGFKCVEFHSGLDDRVANFNLKMFMGDSDINICISIQSLTKGFDFPAIDLVILMRATRSLPLYLQMIGRGSRIIPGLKYWFTCIDYGGNYKRFGWWYDDRDWQELFEPQERKKKEGVAPIKICPKCEYLCPSVAMFCPNCGHEFQKKKIPDVELKMVELTSGFEIKGRHIGDLNPVELAAHAMQDGKRQHAIRVAKAKEIQQPGFLMAFAAAMGYKSGWVSFQQQQLEGIQNLDFSNTIIQ